MSVQVDLDRQLAFVNRLRAGFVLDAIQVRETYGIRKVPEFVERVRDRTGIDIKTAKRTHYEEVIDVYYIAGEPYPETAGLQEMTRPVFISLEDAIMLDPIEFQDGHYVMWCCPNIVDDELCSKFHKVDLGDEPLEGTRIVRCTQCGRQYKIER
jgi:hypothetical protein